MLLGTTSTAFGQGVIYVTPSAPIGFGAGAEYSYNIDLNNDGITDFILFGNVMSVFLIPESGNAVVTGGGFYGGQGVTALNKGDTVSASLDLPYQWYAGDNGLNPIFGSQAVFDGELLADGDFIGKEDAFIGLMFQINGETHYGWMEIYNPFFDILPVVNGQIVQWAYESSPDMPITIFPVPEPTTISMVGMGLVTIILTHKSRKRE